MNEVVPADPRRPYDVRDVIARLVDRSDFLEVQQQFAPNIVVGFGRLMGRTIGVIANQPKVRAGSLDIDASDKASRFIRFCNAFNIPLVNLVDVPGFLPGVQQEYGGIIRHGAKMLFAYAAATVPKLTVVLRKAYGGAYLAMCSHDMGADRVAAWPSGEIAVMGAEGAVSVLYRKDISAADDPQQARERQSPGVQRTVRQPLRGGCTWLGGRGHRTVRDAFIPGGCPRGHPNQARAEASEEAWPDPAVVPFSHQELRLSDIVTNAASHVGGGSGHRLQRAGDAHHLRAFPAQAG